MNKMHGRLWPDYMTPLEIEISCFKGGLTVEEGGPGKAEHFWNYVKIRWPKFIRHPWAEDMIRCACEHRYLAVSGGTGIGKSVVFAAWAIFNWECAPQDTIVLVTSISLSGSRLRIWKYIEQLFNEIPPGAAPGRLVSSLGMIRTQIGGTEAHGPGIVLIAADVSKQKQAIQKFQGIHNKRVILIGDELPELSPAVVNAAVSNLAGNEYFQFIGIGNPGSIYDPHGQLSTPEAGWGSVSPLDFEWKTVLGWHIRFDAEQSPNILAGKVLYPFLPTQETLDKAREDNGANSLQFWKMWRGFWCPEGSIGGIYTETDLVAAKAESRDVDFPAEPRAVAFIDLGYTPDGDASVAVFGRCGPCAEGFDVLLFDDSVTIAQDTTEKKIPPMMQKAKKFAAECRRRGVQKKFAGYDGTASGGMFGELLEIVWPGEDMCYRVDFWGAATDMPVGVDGKLASEVFANRATELWCAGRNFLQCQQLRGIPLKLAKQMTARLFAEPTKRGDHVMTAIESKRKIRQRIGMSPDLADAYFGMLDLCRRLLKFRPASNRSRAALRAWRGFRERAALAETGAAPANLDRYGPEQDAGLSRPKKIIRWNVAPRPGGWGGLSLHG